MLSFRGIPSAPQERVLNGRNISIGDFPWLVSIRDNAHRGFCGGSIVSANYILTAAHCLASKKDLDHVLVGEIDNTLSNAQTIKIEKTYTHPSYQSSSSLDVGIIKLAEPLTFTKNVRPVCLPTNYTDYYHQEVAVHSSVFEEPSAESKLKHQHGQRFLRKSIEEPATKRSAEPQPESPSKKRDAHFLSPDRQVTPVPLTFTTPRRYYHHTISRRYPIT
uniref:Peptidase S1 domain-containing protein n=1 Tax=Ditylenchus dipsaci TaxID=166011 RepID=A0A915DM29_9BILA